MPEYCLKGKVVQQVLIAGTMVSKMSVHNTSTQWWIPPQHCCLVVRFCYVSENMIKLALFWAITYFQKICHGRHHLSKWGRGPAVVMLWMGVEKKLVKAPSERTFICSLSIFFICFMIWINFHHKTGRVGRRPTEPLLFSFMAGWEKERGQWFQHALVGIPFDPIPLKCLSYPFHILHLLL